MPLNSPETLLEGRAVSFLDDFPTSNRKKMGLPDQSWYEHPYNPLQGIVSNIDNDITYQKNISNG